MKLITIFVICSVFSAKAIKYIPTEPPVEETKKPSITVGTGILSYRGDLNDFRKFAPLTDFRMGYHFNLLYRFNNYAGVSFNGLLGKLAHNEVSDTSFLNFQSSITNIGLNLIAYFDNDIIINRTSSFTPFLSAGIGYFIFNPYGDLKDKNGQPYFYWTDGTIHTQPQPPTITHEDSISLTSRDYTYETQLKDTAFPYDRFALSIPLTLGFTFKLSPTVETDISATYCLPFTDYIDNVSRSGSKPKDAFFYTSVSLRYNFGVRKEVDRSIKPKYKKEDFIALTKIDLDNDGVKDDEDLCVGTPYNVKVDARGCPIDTDKDGVPDYIDKESKTPKDVMVDEYGVALTDTLLEMQYNDSLSMWRENVTDISIYGSKTKYLQVADFSNLIIPGTMFVPKEYQYADLNNDGYISPEEINRIIDTFFEGTTNLTIPKINALIDYFFEQ